MQELNVTIECEVWLKIDYSFLIMRHCLPLWAHRVEGSPTEAHAGADGSLTQQHGASLAAHFLSQAAEGHQTGVSSVKHVRGHHLAVDHTQSHRWLGYLRAGGRMVRHLFMLMVNLYTHWNMKIRVIIKWENNQIHLHQILQSQRLYNLIM